MTHLTGPPFPVSAEHLPAGTALVRAAVDGTAKMLLWRDRQLLDPGWSSLDHLLHLPAAELNELARRAEGLPSEASPDIELLAPVESQEVWAAGVTYRRSREARVEESSASEIYDRVYGASRPEIFFKSAGWRVVAPGHPIGIRSDSGWDVPEPELAVLVNVHGEVVAYAVGNDVSSRSIEAANPLYLPQAKIYDRSCALGPMAVLASEVQPGAIALTISREDEIVFEGSSHPGSMMRSEAELISAIEDWYSFPHGFWLLTGTGVIPPLEFTLQAGDVVTVSVDGVGTIRNPVVTIGPRWPGDGSSPLPGAVAEGEGG